jgi:hypothetical protein
MVELGIALVLTLGAALVLAAALPLVYSVARLIGPWDGYPDCWRLLRIISRPK